VHPFTVTFLHRLGPAEMETPVGADHHHPPVAMLGS
jgi:hypothetical protein